MFCLFCLKNVWSNIKELNLAHRNQISVYFNGGHIRVATVKVYLVGQNKAVSLICGSSSGGHSIELEDKSKNIFGIFSSNMLIYLWVKEKVNMKAITIHQMFEYLDY